jgi:metal-dependent amidase/aminoacylase/carboxypeptidase family protein
MTVSEDLSLYQKEIPGLYFDLGILPEGSPETGAASSHSPRFYADEGALIVGVRVLANLAVDYMMQAK